MGCRTKRHEKGVCCTLGRVCMGVGCSAVPDSGQSHGNQSCDLKVAGTRHIQPNATTTIWEINDSNLIRSPVAHASLSGVSCNH